MCMPIGLDVPVVTFDGVEIGTAREILCSSPLGSEGEHPLDRQPIPVGGSADASDLWLRVDRDDRSGLYVPFSAIAEVRAEGVRLAVSAAELGRSAWDSLPDGCEARSRAFA